MSGNILIVCTGNVCRSPYVERLLGPYVADLGLTVSSAGTAALVGSPMEPDSARLLAEAGVSSEGFVSRQLTPPMVVDSDLVLTATRDHRRDVVQLAPKGLRRTFALVDFYDLVAGVELTERVSREDPEAPALRRLADRAMARRAHIPARPADEAEIEDPFRRGRAAFDRMASQIDVVLPDVVAAIRGAADR